MTDRKNKNFIADSFEFFQKTLRSAGPAASASYTLIGAVIILGLVGYWLDKWLNTSPWLLFSGLILGLVVGFYELAKVIWRK
ncbi:MAG: AtpZ/AtpI family protein [Candidatus Marinimicrobia bacterium]|nr:AtpZ/AtpI family protein [Candidatus Neomarinimicrobiota bacterium]